MDLQKFSTASRAVLMIATAVLLLLLAGVAAAGTATVTWTHPTQYTNGAPLALVEVESTRIEWGTCGTGGVFGTKLGESVVLAPATGVQVSSLTFGDKCFRGYTKVKPAFGGLESAASSVAIKLIPASPPRPPVITTIEAVAYEIRMHPINGPMLGRAVGRVPLGTPCGEEPIVYAGLGSYNVVPTEAVTLTKNSRQDVFIARCGFVAG